MEGRFKEDALTWKDLGGVSSAAGYCRKDCGSDNSV